MKLSATSVVITFIIISFLASKIVAQSRTNGITVSPSIMEIDLADDLPEYNLQFINNTSETIVLRLKAQDFTELEDGWKVNFLEPKDANNYRYALSSWISFNKRTLTLGPREKSEVTIAIDADELSSGGHYAAILAEVDQPSDTDQIGVKFILTSLLFVRTHTGKEIESAQISSMRPLQSWFDFPEIFIFRLQNSGTVELIPYGTISILGPFGRIVVKNAVNEESFITLPETIKRYEVKLKDKNRFLLPGVYTAKLDIHYGKSMKKVTSELRFFSLGSISIPYILVFTLGIVVIVLLRKKVNFVFLQKR